MRPQTNTVHFDKELTSRDTMRRFVRFCVKKSKKHSVSFANAVLFIFSILKFFRVLSVGKCNDLLIRWFCPLHTHTFENYCFEFSQYGCFTPMYGEVKANTSITIVSTSPKAYIQYLFPNHRVIAPEFMGAKHKIIKTENVNYKSKLLTKKKDL